MVGCRGRPGREHVRQGVRALRRVLSFPGHGNIFGVVGARGVTSRVQRGRGLLHHGVVRHGAGRGRVGRVEVVDVVTTVLLLLDDGTRGVTWNNPIIPLVPQI